MKTQFDLNEFEKDRNKKIKTREGKNARILCTDKIGEYPVVALLKTDDGFEKVCSFDEKGCVIHGGSSDMDLFFDDGVTLDEFQQEVRRIMKAVTYCTPCDLDVINESQHLLKLAEKVLQKQTEK